jgi:hypothetical protein
VKIHATDLTTATWIDIKNHDVGAGGAAQVVESA